MRQLAILALAVSLTGLTGCAARQSTITGLPAGTTQTQVQQWDSAVAQLHNIVAANSTLRQAVIQLNQQGVFPSGQAYVDVLTAIGKIDQSCNAAAVFLQSVPSTWGVSTQAQMATYTSEISAALQTLTNEGVTGVKATASQQQISTLIGQMAAAVNLIVTLA